MSILKFHVKVQNKAICNHLKKNIKPLYIAGSILPGMINIKYILVSLLILLSGRGTAWAQEWEFAREKDGIKVYTRFEKESKFKSFKGELDIEADLSEVSSLIEDVKNFDRWDEDVSEIRVLEQEEGKMLKYYVVYDVPWPLHDRDLCVEAVITADQATGSKLILARSVPEAVPLNDDLVRIIDYRQKWILQPKENGIVHITIEGYADPAGDIPAWIVNMAITDTPLNILRAVKETLDK